jgi:hypothetical protein
MRTKSLSFAVVAGLAVALISVFISLPANATLIQANSRAALGANLTINWGLFGPAGTNLSCYCNAPAGPIDVHVNGSSGTLNRFDEGTDYTGNFAVGDQLLSQPYLSDLMTVGFSAPVQAVGTQIQPLSYAGAFTAYIHVLTNDGMDALFSVAGLSTVGEDNSAPFIGVTSTLDDIVAMTFTVDIGNATFPRSGALAINQMSVVVPEPATLAMFLFALLTVLVVRRRWSV